MQVHVLIVHQNYDDFFTAHSTNEGAWLELHNYVKRHWDNEITDDDGKPTPIPADPEEAIATYFEDSNESYQIEECRLLEWPDDYGGS